MANAPATVWERTFETLHTGAYTEYRIPGIVVTPAGTLLCCYEGRAATNDDWARIDTVICRSTDDGETWTKTVITVPEQLGGTPEDCVNNPTLIVDGTLTHLIYHQNYARAFHRFSADDGVTWSAPEEITGAYREAPYAWNVCATGPGHGIRLKGGRLLAPIWLANGRVLDARRIAHQPSLAGCVYSDDHGMTWHTGALTEGIADANETTVAQLPDGRVLFNHRNRESDLHRRLTVSADGGMTLSSPTLCADLPDPMCFAGMTALADGRIAYAGCINDGDISPDAPRGRVNLTMMITEDGGASWQKLCDVAPIGGYADVASYQNFLYVLYEVTEQGDISRMMLRKIAL